MQTEFTQLKANYRFSKADEALLKQISPHMAEHTEAFVDAFYEHILKLGDAAKYLRNEQVIARHRAGIEKWYFDLFGGDYGVAYFMKLYRVGQIHVDIGLPTHYVNVSFNYVRIFVLQIINKYYSEHADRDAYLKAAERIIDINLDVLTSSYREEEMRDFLSLSALEKNILGSLKKASTYINFLLSIALVFVAFFGIGLFTYDVYLLLSGNVPIEQGILTVLGSLLVLWAVIELINEEIKHLRGEGFALEAFVILAIAAVLRKILIFSLSSEQVMNVVWYSVVVLFMGIVYWLITESRRRGRPV